jgi:ribonuclease HI
MSVRAPHFLLFSEARRQGEVGEWRFVLRAADGSECVEAQDREPRARGDRLELLALVRGLEALDQPSRVTLLTRSPYVERGLSRGLDDWRQNGWSWEYFGQMAPIVNRDLWQRVDRALDFHAIEVNGRRFDPAHRPPANQKEIPASTGRQFPPAAKNGAAPARRSTLRRQWQRATVRLRRGMREGVHAAQLAYSQLGAPLTAPPWLG